MGGNIHNSGVEKTPLFLLHFVFFRFSIIYKRLGCELCSLTTLAERKETVMNAIIVLDSNAQVRMAAKEHFSDLPDVFVLCLDFKSRIEWPDVLRVIRDQEYAHTRLLFVDPTARSLGNSFANPVRVGLSCQF